MYTLNRLPFFHTSVTCKKTPKLRVFFFFFSLLRIESRASSMLDRVSTTELYPQSSTFLSLIKDFGTCTCREREREREEREERDF
jgi:hypothetical protein